MAAHADHILVVNHTFRRLLANVENSHHRGKGIASSGVGGESFVHNQHSALTIIENKDNLRTGQANVQGNDDCAHAGAGVVKLQIAMTVEHQHSHAVAAL